MGTPRIVVTIPSINAGSLEIVRTRRIQHFDIPPRGPAERVGCSSRRQTLGEARFFRGAGVSRPQACHGFGWRLQVSSSRSGSRDQSRTDKCQSPRFFCNWCRCFADGQREGGRKDSASHRLYPFPRYALPCIGLSHNLKFSGSGQYLSQLCRHCQLPDLIDPTAPSEPVRIDPITNTFEPPAHPEVFSALAPLPPSMQLEPLINIQKQRRIAGVIKSLVTGQHLASKLQFPIDKKLFQRCLRLKALDEDTLFRVYAMYPD